MPDNIITYEDSQADTGYKRHKRMRNTKPPRHITTSNFKTDVANVTLPLPPVSETQDTRFEMDIYVRFMRHLRHVPNSRMEIKILSAIQFTADVLEVSDALVAKILIDLGLRASRQAFPVSFLDFVDQGAQRSLHERSTLPPSVIGLRSFWDTIGESKFAPIMSSQHYAICCYADY